jgi:hypothetical protein
MDWMSPAATTIFELPNFDGPTLRCSKNAPSIVPTDTVDLPVTTLSLKLEVARCDSGICWEWDLEAAIVVSARLNLKIGNY